MPIARTQADTRYSGGAIGIPRGSVAVGTLGGFLGFYTPAFFVITEAQGSALVAGVVVEYLSGSFVVLSSGDETDDPHRTYQVTVSRLFDEASAEAQVKLSVSELDPTEIGQKILAKRLEQPALLTPGIYRVDFGATLSETYELDGDSPGVIPQLRVNLVPVKFRPWFFSDDAGTPCFGAEAYTERDLDTGTLGNTPYAFPEGAEPPLAIDVRTGEIRLVEWEAILLQRAIGLGLIPDAGRRAALTAGGYIRDAWATELAEAPSGGGALDKQQTYKTALGRISWETGYDFDWTSPDARLIRLPRVGEDPDVQRTIGIDDVKRISDDDPRPQLAVRWTTEADVVNLAYPRYLRDYSESEGQFGSYDEPGTNVDTDTADEDKIGGQADEERFYFDWLRDLPTTDEVTTTWLKHLGLSAMVVDFTGFLEQCDLERGDILAFDLAPNITIGEAVGSPDENQGYGEGGYGSGGYGGSSVSPSGTIKGEQFLDPSWKFKVQTVAHNFLAGEVKVSALRIY